MSEALHAALHIITAVAITLAAVFSFLNWREVKRRRDSERREAERQGQSDRVRGAWKRLDAEDKRGVRPHDA